jgi:HK97 family phage prohead protease
MRDLLTRSLPDAVRARLDVDNSALIQAGVATRSSGNVVESRGYKIEARANDDGTYHVSGYATTWDTWYDVAGGAPYGWSESIARGAATKSLAERDDVRFLINHEGLPLARTASKTMTLEADDMGLRVDIESLDLSNPVAQELRSALDRGDVDQMSFAFMAVRQEWNDDYTERRITEVRLFDVSAVTYPANPATIIGLRSAPTKTESAGGMSLTLALAMAESLG